MNKMDELNRLIIEQLKMGNISKDRVLSLMKELYIKPTEFVLEEAINKTACEEDFLEVIKKMSVEDLGGFIRNSTKEESITLNMPIEIVGVKEFYPLSMAQKRIYILNEIFEVGFSFNLTRIIPIQAGTKKESLEAAIEKLIDRHEVLRSFINIVNGELVHIVNSNIKFELEYYTVSGSGVKNEENEKEEAQKIIKQFVRPFDLTIAPLFRAAMLKQDKNNQLLLLDFHHIICDDFSIDLFIKEIQALLLEQNLPDIKYCYTDFTGWQERLIKLEVLKNQENYWLDIFSGEIPVLNLQTDYNRPQVKSFEGAHILVNADKKLTEKVKSFAFENEVTLFITLFAAYNILLYKYTGQEDIVVGSPVTGRRHAGTENIAGLLKNTLALRNYPLSGLTFKEFLQNVKQNTISAYNNQEYPIETLINKINLPMDFSRNALFDTLFELQNRASTDYIGYRQFENNASKFDISIYVFEEEGELKFDIEYCTKLFKKETIARLAIHYINTIAEVIEKPFHKLMEVEMMSEEEKRQIILNFNNTETADYKGITIQQLFEKQVQWTPDNTAIICGNTQLTYNELNSKANKLARYLIHNGVRRGSIVGIVAKRSPEMLIGILGILKAGGAYLPMDPDYPKERICYTLSDSGTNFILTYKAPYMCSSIGESKIIDIDDEEIHMQDEADLENKSKATDAAYVIYTSSSTGKPKGVIVEHGSVCNFIKGVSDKIKFLPDKSMLCLTTICFDKFVLETILPLTRGLKVIIATEEQQKNINELSRLIIKHNIDMVQMTPSKLQLLINKGTELSCFENIKEIMIGGETFPTALLEELKKVTRARIYNLYGPTETTIWSTVSDLTDIASVDIGKPIANTNAYILDENKRLQAIGIPGELYIGGNGLARGYANRPELTARNFTTYSIEGIQERLFRTGDMARWLSDGNIECLGRCEYQLKVRGFRIELREIESRLLMNAAVKEAMVLSRKDKAGNNYLCAYIVQREEIAEAELLDSLALELPDYMIPSYIIKLDSMPMTLNGKVDRDALPLPIKSNGDEDLYVSPRNYTELILSNIWKNVLSVDKVGINDNFFNIGGNAMKAKKVIYEAACQNIKLTIHEIFKYKTIARINDNMKSNLESELQNSADDSESIYKISNRWPSFKVFEKDEDNVKELKIEMQRDIASSMHRALPLCVVLADRNLHSWYYEHFINIFSITDESGSITLDYLERWGLYADVIGQIQIGANLMEKENNIIGYIIERIKQGYYINISVDEYYLSRKQRYQKMHFIHHVLVYGYNDTERKVMTVGFDEESIMNKIDYSYDEFFEAYEKGKLYYQESAPWTSRTAVQLFYSNVFSEAYPYSIKKVIHELNNYLSSDGDDSLRYYWALKKEQVSYGLGVYDEVIRQLKGLLQRKNIIEYRLIQFLSEHKKVVLQRLKYIAENYSMNNRFIENYNIYLNIVDKFEEVRLKFIDLQNGLAFREELTINSHDGFEQTINEIIDIIACQKEKEKFILTEIYEVLRSNFN